MNHFLKNFLSLSLVISVSACSRYVNDPLAGSAREVKIEKLNIRSFDQMNETMSAITEVPMSKLANLASATSTYNSSGSTGLRNQLPQAGSLNQFNASHQAAIVQLAAPYCDAYVAGLVANSAALLVAKYPFMSGFTDSTANDFTDAKILKFSSTMYSNFWRACRNKPSLESTQEEISTLIGSLKNDFKGTALDKPSNYIKIMCVAYLASSCVSVY